MERSCDSCRHYAIFFPHLSFKCDDPVKSFALIAVFRAQRQNLLVSVSDERSHIITMTALRS